MQLKTKFKTIFAAGTVALSAIAALSGFVTAGPAYELEYTYYDSNGAYIGTKLYTCSGGVYQSGKTSSNYDVIRVPCEEF